MSLDPVAFVRAQRAIIRPEGHPDLRPAAVGGDDGNAERRRAQLIAELPRGPGDPGWRERIPPPADARPGDVVSVPGSGSQEQTASVALSAGPPAAPTDRRIVVTCGRGDSFNLAVEVAPDWEVVDQWRFEPEQVLAALPILRALDIKIRDLTAGELAMLELEHKDERVRARPAQAAAGVGPSYPGNGDLGSSGPPAGE